jgi:hypothetical protein
MPDEQLSEGVFLRPRAYPLMNTAWGLSLEISAASSATSNSPPIIIKLAKARMINASACRTRIHGAVVTIKDPAPLLHILMICVAVVDKCGEKKGLKKEPFFRWFFSERVNPMVNPPLSNPVIARLASSRRNTASGRREWSAATSKDPGEAMTGQAETGNKIRDVLKLIYLHRPVLQTHLSGDQSCLTAVFHPQFIEDVMDVVLYSVFG